MFAQSPLHSESEICARISWSGEAPFGRIYVHSQSDNDRARCNLIVGNWREEKCVSVIGDVRLNPSSLNQLDSVGIHFEGAGDANLQERHSDLGRRDLDVQAIPDDFRTAPE